VSLDDGLTGIWLKDELIFKSDEIASNTLTGGEPNIGIGDGGEFIYSPSVDGDDAVWGQNGLIAVENTQAPDFPDGINSTFHSRPLMANNGAAYWVSGFNDGMGGMSSVGRMIYRQDPTTGAIQTIVRAGDSIGGRRVAPFGGIDFDFAVSPDDANRMLIFNDDASDSASDGTLVVNDVVIATEGAPTGQGDNWDNFDRVDVNNLGNFAFSGDTDGNTDSDEFIAYNGEIKLRQGDSVDGRTLGTSLDTLALNNLNQMAYIWNTDLDETLFYAADASDPASAIELLSVGDQIDTDGDSIADFTINDFNATDSEDLGFGSDGFVYVNVDLRDTDGAVAGEAVIRVVIPSPSAAVLMAISGVAALRRRRG
jgi:hypothetical protein